MPEAQRDGCGKLGECREGYRLTCGLMTAISGRDEPNDMESAELAGEQAPCILQLSVRGKDFRVSRPLLILPCGNSAFIT